MSNNDYSNITVFTILLAANVLCWVPVAAFFAMKYVSRLVLG